MTKTIPYPRRQFVRGVLKSGIALAFGLLADIKVNGRENLPAGGPLIVVGNHFHFLDPLMFIHLLPYPAEFVGGAKMPNAPTSVHFFERMFGVIPTARGTVSRDTLYGAESVLRQNGVLAIFPEGGSWATVLRPPRPGTAFLAWRTGARILPIGIDGTVGFFKNLGKRRAAVTLNVGEPFGPLSGSGGGRPSRAELDEMGHAIMRHISPLIPPERRGFYSDDPAIREAARGSEIYPFANVAEV